MTHAANPLPSDYARALSHLRLALISLDSVGERRASPYIQMAIDILEGWSPDEGVVPNAE